MKKTILITGASKGIGYETALAFAREGHRVWALARTESRLNQLLADAKGLTGEIQAIKTDITQFDPALLPEVPMNIDIVILNAGALINKPFIEISPEELFYIYNVNVFAPFQMIRQLMPRLSASAHIVGIGSAGGVYGTQKFPGLSAYSSSKASLSSLMECLQAEYAKTDLAFNSLALGAVQTEMLREAFPGYEAKISPSEMASFISNFALNSQAVLRGQTILVTKTNP